MCCQARDAATHCVQSVIDNLVAAPMGPSHIQNGRVFSRIQTIRAWRITERFILCVQQGMNNYGWNRNPRAGFGQLIRHNCTKTRMKLSGALLKVLHSFKVWVILHSFSLVTIVSWIVSVIFINFRYGRCAQINIKFYRCFLGVFFLLDTRRPAQNGRNTITDLGNEIDCVIFFLEEVLNTYKISHRITETAVSVSWSRNSAKTFLFPVQSFQR